MFKDGDIVITKDCKRRLITGIIVASYSHQGKMSYMIKEVNEKIFQSIPEENIVSLVPSLVLLQVET